MHRIKSKRLRELIDAHGDFGLAKASQGARLSVSTLEKMYAGTYRNSVREVTRERMLSYFKVPEADLFDGVGASSGGRAS